MQLTGRRSIAIGWRTSTTDRRFERMMAAFDRFDRAFDENRVFKRDIQQAQRARYSADDRRHRGGGPGARAAMRDSNAKSEQILAELKDGREEWREEFKAHREALLALIDRLPPPEAA